MTPWFAAAAGFVIAASLWIYSPHPQMAFPAIAIGKVPCSSGGCGPQVDPQGIPSLTINSGSPLHQQYRSPTRATTGTGSPANTAASGLTFGYVVRRATRGNFAVVVSVTGKLAVKNWRLSFVLPGDHIESVLGAQWQAAGSDGGTASPLTGDQGQQDSGHWNAGGRQNNQGGDQGDYGRGRSHQPGFIFFTVFASGATPAPTQCSYDGASCTFREVSSGSQAGFH